MKQYLKHQLALTSNEICLCTDGTSARTDVQYVPSSNKKFVILGSIHTHPQKGKTGGILEQERGPSYPGGGVIEGKSDVQTAKEAGYNIYTLDRERYVARHSTGDRELLGSKGNANIAKDASKTFKGVKK